MACKALPPVEYLRECFSYDPATGILTWLQRPREHFANEKTWRNINGQFAGKPALACWSPKKGCVGRIANLDVLAHRVIYKFVTGNEPDGVIDHIDGDRRNNRWANLRCVTPAVNARNRARNSRTTAIAHGVRWHQGGYEASIKHNKQQIYIGRFPAAEQAVEARRAVELSMGHHPNHGRPAHKETSND